MKRSRLTRRTPLRSRAPLRSRVRRRDHAERPLATWCEIAHPGVCTGRAEHRHHVVLQSQGGRGGPTLDVCVADHRYVHEHPEWAYAHGFLMHPWDAA